MRIHGICENKCQVDITNKLNNFVKLEDMGFTAETSLTKIVESMDETGVLIYNVTPSNQDIYPITSESIVIIQKSNENAIAILFYQKEMYINQYISNHFEGWNHLSAFRPKGSFTITLSKIGANAELPAIYQLNTYGISGSGLNAIVTPITNIGFDLSYSYGITDDKALWFKIKNNTSEAKTNIKFRVCII